MSPATGRKWSGRGGRSGGEDCLESSTLFCKFAVNQSPAMPNINNTPQPKPWYKNSNTWGWIVTGVCLLAFIIFIIEDNAADERAKANRPKPRSYEEVFTPEEAKRMGIGGRIDGPGDWKPDPNAAKNVREFIEKGGNADPAGDAIQDGDYHDLLHQNGGPGGF